MLLWWTDELQRSSAQRVMVQATHSFPEIVRSLKLLDVTHLQGLLASNLREWVSLLLRMFEPSSTQLVLECTGGLCSARFASLSPDWVTV
mmetsp:Transcript_25192/g.52286  ORF Transcript_25192/g.52286 Transcript_25192/m.52286 type:complete len:90 (-) Transcript_25192:537-806(-)